jgi:hypothetical protein
VTVIAPAAGELHLFAEALVPRLGYFGRQREVSAFACAASAAKGEVP